MRRWLGWFFGGLAVATAVRAAARPGRSPGSEALDDGLSPSADRPAEAAGFREVTSGSPATSGLLGAGDVGKSVIRRLRDHATSMMAGSLAYYAMLSIFPAAIATVSIYGLVQDPADVSRQLDNLADVLPSEAATIIRNQLTSIVGSSPTGLGVATAISVIGALWSASGGTKNLMAGINRAYDRTEDRKFLPLRGLALLLTLGIILFIVTAVSLSTFLPALLEDVGLGRAGRTAVEWGRWPVIFLAVVLGLGLLYKIAPNRPTREQEIFSAGALAASALWLVVTMGFSYYAGQFGKFNQTYGTLGGVIVLLLWFYLSGLIVLVGAELNAELEARALAEVP